MNTTLLAQVDIDELPPEVVDSLPDDIVQQLKDGVLDAIPEDIVDSLPSAVQDKIPEGLLEAASSNPTFTKVLLVIGVIAVIGFIFGVVKSAIKWMIYSAIVGVAAWYFFFQQ
ncbi:MAG: hypothetical protein QNJ77_00815 [Acidimicrobiia bacterium]|nr:hypothetical protein [Acidimicrobiia bacterium]